MAARREAWFNSQPDLDPELAVSTNFGFFRTLRAGSLNC